MASKQAALGSKGKRKQSLHPILDISPSSMTSASRTKYKKNSRDSRINPAEPSEDLSEVAVGAGSEACIPFLPSSSRMVVATTGSSSNEGPSLLEASVLLSEGMETEETQRDQCEEAFHSVKTHSQSRLTASASGIVSEVESIVVDEITADEVVDLTSDSEQSVLVDLTHNDSVIMVEENREWQNTEFKSQQLPDILILSSDDDSKLKESSALVASKCHGDFVKDRVASSKPLGTVSCPICLDGYSEIVHSGRLIVSTKCGHIFCNQCLCNYLRNTSSCPNCRKNLSHKEYHPVYI